MEEKLQIPSSEKAVQDELTQNMRDIVTRWDTDGRLLFSNRRTEHYTGFSAEEAEGLEYKEITKHLGGAEKWQSGFRRCIVSGKPVTVTAPAETKMGEHVFFETEICPEFDDVRNLKGFIAVSREITQKSETRSRTERLACSTILIAELAANFISAQPAEKPELFASLLERCAGVVGGDRAFLFSYDFQAGTLSNTYEWCAEGIDPQIDRLQSLSLKFFPEIVKAHRSGTPYVVRETAILHPGSETRKSLEAQGVKTLITVPTVTEVGCTGFLGIDFVREARDVGLEEIHLLTTLSRFIAAFEVKYPSGRSAH